MSGPPRAHAKILDQGLNECSFDGLLHRIQFSDFFSGSGESMSQDV
jgi:hypothetical protein